MRLVQRIEKLEQKAPNNPLLIIWGDDPEPPDAHRYRVMRIKWLPAVGA